MLAIACALPATAERITGKVVQDDSGAPVVSAAVKISKQGSPRLTADLESDTDGRFDAPELDPGEYRVEVGKPGYARVRVTVVVRTGATASVNLRIARFGSISGRVTDAARHSIEGTRVLPVNRALRPFIGSGAPARVSSTGEYRIYNLPPGQYAVAVSYGASPFAVGSSGHKITPASAGSGAQLYPSNAHPQWFTIDGGEEYRGIDFTIPPIGRTSVVGQVNKPCLTTAVMPAEQDGSFRFDGISSGSYFVFAVGPVNGYSGTGSMLGPAPFFGRMRVDVSAAEVCGLSIPVEKAGVRRFDCAQMQVRKSTARVPLQS